MHLQQRKQQLHLHYFHQQQQQQQHRQYKQHDQQQQQTPAAALAPLRSSTLWLRDAHDFSQQLREHAPHDYHYHHGQQERYHQQQQRMQMQMQIHHWQLRQAQQASGVQPDICTALDVPKLGCASELPRLQQPHIADHAHERELCTARSSPGALTPSRQLDSCSPYKPHKTSLAFIMNERELSRATATAARVSAFELLASAQPQASVTPVPAVAVASGGVLPLYRQRETLVRRAHQQCAPATLRDIAVKQEPSVLEPTALPRLPSPPRPPRPPPLVSATAATSTTTIAGAGQFGAHNPDADETTWRHSPQLVDMVHRAGGVAGHERPRRDLLTHCRVGPDSHSHSHARVPLDALQSARVVGGTLGSLASHLRSVGSRATGADIGAATSIVTSAAANMVATSQKRKTSKSMTYEEKRRARACRIDGCVNYIINRGLCFRHGGGKKCSTEGCTSSAKNAGKCWKHGGSVKCLVDGCERRGKSRGFCWAHGGGTKCSSIACSKVAVSNGYCWAHGGGKRCAYDGCKKAAYERTYNYCLRHHDQLKDGSETLEV